MPIFAFVLAVVFAAFVLQRSAAIRTAITNALTGAAGHTAAAVLNAAHYTLVALRIMVLAAAIYLGLLFAVTAIGWAPAQLAVLSLGLIVAFAAMYILATLRLPVAEIATRLTAAGTWASSIPLDVKPPEGFAPGSAIGWKIAPAYLLGIILSVVNGLWLFPALIIWALGGILNAFGALAVIAEKTLRTLARSFATVGMGLLFLTVAILVDASLGTHVLDFGTLVILTLLFMAATFMSFLATDRLGTENGIPWSALWLGTLSIGLLLGMLYAHIDPMGARQIGRAFRNSKDTALTFARIGNDQGQITSHAYWRTRADTVLRPCANCTAKSGTISGRVGDPVEVKASASLASLRAEEPVELDGVLWLRVFRPYKEDKPATGFNLGPQAVWLAPKDYLDGDVRPETPEPRAPLLTTLKGMPAKLTALAPLMLFSGVLLLPVILLGGTSLLGRAFSRPNAAAAGATGTAAARSSGPGHNDDLLPNSLTRGILIVGGLFVLSPLLAMALSMFWQSGGRTLPTQPAIWMLTSSAMLTLLVVAVFVGSIPIVFFAHDKWGMFKKCLFILLLASVIKLAVPDVSAAFTPDRFGPGASGQPISLSLIPPAAAAVDTSISTLIQRAAAYHGIAPELVMAICLRESGCNANSPDGGDGEIGPMQVMPGTAAHYGVTSAQLRDPKTNIDVGARLLADYVREFPGRVDIAVHAYYSPRQARDFYSRGLTPDQMRAELDREITSPAGVKHNPWKMLTRVIKF